MADLSRRAFLRKASVGAAAGAGAIGALAGGTPAKALARELRRAAEPQQQADGEPVVAYVSDQARDEVTIMVGTREVTHRDPDLARRIRRAAS
ncbi:MAG TPA: hypothetical protein VFC04_04105 [Actinomycetota bacterium]|nr:hypothetical protein [Actinomycetota bacterium]